MTQSAQMTQAAAWRQRRAQRGTAMVEMALVLPVYFLLVYGIFQICLITFGYCNATFAVRMAARYASLHGTGSTYQCTSLDLQSIVKQYAWGLPGNAVITSTWSPDNNSGSTVTVGVSMSFPTGIPFSSLKQIPVGTSVKTTVLR